MARWWNRQPGDAVNKALPALPPGARVTQPSNAELQAMARQLQNAKQYALMASANASLSRQWSDPEVPFGPGFPTPAAPINPPRDDGTGRPAPRQYEYPVAWNLPGAGRKLIPWQMLRQAGDLDIVRALIEAKKQELCGYDWTVGIGKRALAQAVAEDPNTPRAVLEKDMRQHLNSDILKAQKFWEMPSRDQQWDWAQWLSTVLEEMLVLDALAIYPVQAPEGLRSLNVLDGSTIKPLLDQYGMPPAPPLPAFQQILYGFPRGEFVADADPDGSIPNGMSGDRLIYRRSVIRTWTPYGYSAVERALPIIGLLADRDAWIKSEYTDGATPDVFITPDKDSDITVDSFQMWQQTLNERLGGWAEERRRMQVSIPGSTLHQFEHDSERYKPDYDLYLLQRLSAHFDLTLTELGFIQPKGLGSAGFHEGQDDVVMRRNTIPWTRKLATLCTHIMVQHMGIDPALEFQFLGLDDEDEAATDAVVDAKVRGGRMTLNEARDAVGEDRYDFPEADQPFIASGREIVFIQGQLERQAQKDAAAQAAMDNLQDPANGGTPGLVDPDKQGAQNNVPTTPAAPRAAADPPSQSPTRKASPPKKASPKKATH